MTDEQFDALVILIWQLAWRATGKAGHQQRAGSPDEDIERAREVLVYKLPDIL